MRWWFSLILIIKQLTLFKRNMYMFILDMEVKVGDFPHLITYLIILLDPVFYSMIIVFNEQQ